MKQIANKFMMKGDSEEGATEDKKYQKPKTTQVDKYGIAKVKFILSDYATPQTWMSFFTGDDAVTKKFFVTASYQFKEVTNKTPVKLIITSTIRSTRKQAEVMYSNESNGNHIRYAAPGRAVIEVFNTGKSRGDSKEKISDMDKKIKELSENGQRVSLHCVSKEAYNKNNIIDISYSRGAKNP
ncbi:hypothetical protein [Chryseobacterium indoltheticum]|uniref:hypothetical protein n=1 Tax=Chryseobacterium indoltheticum TaxID=254 RepID=UPI0028E368B8|nr:hypothetical protein [Chryseobacterium indoltheticum]